MNMMDHEPIWNHPLPDPQANLDGTSCAMFSSKDFGAYGPNTLAYTNVASTTNYPSMPILNLEVPSYVRANVGMSQEPYVHCLSSRNTSPFPHYYVQRELCFSHLNVGDLSGIANFSVDATYKRNMPTIQNFSDSGSTNACYNAASSFSHPVSTGILDSRQTLDLHYSRWNPNRMVSGCRSNNLLSPGLDQRKVRGQSTCVLHPGNASSDHFHSGPTTSVLNAPGQWNHCAPISLNSHARLIHTSDISSFNHELNQLHGAPHIDGGHNFCLIPGPPTPDLAVYHNTYEQRTNYRPNLSYQPLGFEANMVEFRQPAEETDVLRRHSRGLSTVGHVSERNGRGRIIHHASSPQTLAVMDGSMFSGSTNLFDENHDMRLDIENMSYEELLALGEQIGNVNTGLSEAAISRCLVESIYYFDQIQDSQKEGRCIICLESYKDGDCVGRLHCRHDFHVCCIKKWLLIKNECPICKASAMETTLVV